MASINGISLKAVKMFRGHEGEPCYQGNVYIGKKKIGFWSQDSWGAVCDNFMFDKPYSAGKLAEKVKALCPERIETRTRDDGSTYTLCYTLEELFTDLLVLQDDEKAFKKANKDGRNGLITVTDGYHQISFVLKESALSSTDDVLLDKLSKFIESEKKKARFFNENDYIKHEVKIYRDIKDFNIGVEISVDDIKEGAK